MMKGMCVGIVSCVMCVLTSCSAVQESARTTSTATVWSVDNLETIGGNPVTVVGTPSVISTPDGKAVYFDGLEDGLFVDVNPVEGMSSCTIEVMFRPDSDGLEEQRFVHIQEAASQNRFMIETRLTGNGTWCADTFIGSAGRNNTLIDRSLTHPCDTWHTVAITFDGHTMKQYVNGEFELSRTVKAYTPMKAGQTSLGVRQNKVYWFKGSIAQVRCTDRALSAEELLLPPRLQNESVPDR